MNILIADDDIISLKKLERILRKDGHEVFIAMDGDEAWEKFGAPGAPDLAVIDWMMPGMDGVDICRRMRCDTSYEYKYIILLTARDSREDIIEGLEAGADDYIVKPFDPHELRVRIRAGIRIIELQQNLILAQEALREKATFDSLTGLLNRSEIMDMIRRELNGWQQRGAPFGILMVDVDHFKRINDTYGHQAGDEVLSHLAELLQRAVRPYDGVGRYGGEEFIVVLDGCSAGDVEVAGERVRKQIGDTPFTVDGLELKLTVSIGGAHIEGVVDASVEGIIQKVDRAMYKAKRDGRNRLVVAGRMPASE